MRPIISLPLSGMEERPDRASGASTGPASWPGVVLGLFWAAAPLVYRRDLVSAYELPKAAVVLAGSLVGTLLLVLARTFRGNSLRLPGEVLAYLLFLVAAMGSLAGSSAPAEGIPVMLDAVGHLGWWVLGAVLLTGPRRRLALLAGVVVGGAATAAIGGLQWADLDTWKGTGGGPGLFAALPQNDEPGSVFGHVNPAAEVVMMAALAGMGLLLRRCGGRLTAALLVLALLLDGSFLVVSGSRAAWLGVLCGGLALGTLEYAAAGRTPEAPRRRRRLLAAAAAAVVVVVLGFLVLDQWVTVPGRGETQAVPPRARLLALARPEAGTLLERRTLWANTLEMVDDHPLLGVGPGNWKIAYPAYGRAAATHPPERFGLDRQPERTHMDPLQLLAETGWLGLVLMAAFAFPGLLRGVRRSLEPGARGLRALLGVLAGLAATSLVAFPFLNPVPGGLAFLLLGAAAAQPARRALRLGPATLRWGLAAGLLVLIVGGGNMRARLLADHDYRRSRAALDQARETAGEPGARPAANRGLLFLALDTVDRAAVRQPANYRYQLHRAGVLWDLGLGDHVERVLERTLDLHPNLVNPLLGLAEIRRHKGDWDGAWKLLHRARRIFPSSPEVLAALGHHFYARSRLPARGEAEERRRRNDRTTAAALYRRALEQRPHNPDVRLSLARLLLDEGGPLFMVVQLAEAARVEAAGDPSRLAGVARLYADPRMGRGGGLFGPTGNRTVALWRQVLAASGGTHREAFLEVNLLPLKRALAGAPEPGRKELENMLALVEETLEVEPGHLQARFFQANLLELLDRPREALLAWGVLLRRAAPHQVQDPRAGSFLEQAREATVRLKEQLGMEAGDDR